MMFQLQHHSTFRMQRKVLNTCYLLKIYFDVVRFDGSDFWEQFATKPKEIINFFCVLISKFTFKSASSTRRTFSLIVSLISIIFFYSKKSINYFLNSMIYLDKFAFKKCINRKTNPTDIFFIFNNNIHSKKNINSVINSSTNILLFVSLQKKNNSTKFSNESALVVNYEFVFGQLLTSFFFVSIFGDKFRSNFIVWSDFFLLNFITNFLGKIS